MQRILSPRERIIAYAAGLIIAAVVAWNFLFEPLTKKHRSLNQEISLAEARLNEYRMLLSQREQLQKIQRELFPANSPSLEGEGGLFAVLTQLEQYAQKAGVVIIDIRPQGTKAEGKTRLRLLELKAEGSISGLVTFIHTLEKSSTLLKVTQLYLSAKPNSETLEASLVIAQLFYP